MSGVAIEEDDELVLCFCLKLRFCIHVFVFASSFFFYKIQDATSALVSTDAGEKFWTVLLVLLSGRKYRPMLNKSPPQCTHFFTSTHCAMPTSASSKSKAQTTADNASSQLFFSCRFSGFTSKTLPELSFICHRPLTSSNIRSTPSCPFISGFIFRPCSRTSRPGASAATSGDVLKHVS